MARNPNDTTVEEEYIYEVHGEIKVPAYSEEEAEERIKEDLGELIEDAIRNGSIEIK